MRVLVVEDDPTDRALIRRELAREFPDHSVVEPVDAADFQAALEAGAFDVVIADYHLRWTDGLAVLQAVKARRPDCPVVMFTATGDQEVAVAAMKAGVDDYLVKAPQHFIRLPGAVRHALERAELRAERRRAEVERARLLERERAARAEAEAALRRAELAERRATFLAEASRVLSASLDYEATLESVARLAVPALADYCIVDLLDTERATRAVAVAHRDPAKEALAREMRSRFPPDPDRAHPVWEAFRTGRPQLFAEVGEAWFQAVARSPRHLELMRSLGPRSQIVTPLVARGRALGVITFVYADSGRRYGPADLAPADELAGRMALAVDNARLFREAQAAIREALAATRARESFLARASHELRTPLTSALGTVRLLRKARPGRLPEPPDAMLAVVDRNLTAMAALIDDLLDASKLAAGQEKLAREQVDLAEAVGRSLEVIGPQAREKGVALRVAVPAGLTLPADRLKLEQVLVNLLANAVKFTPAGGQASVEAAREGEGVVLRVRDTGEGIAPDQLERIFEPFYQAGGLGESRVVDRRARRIRGTGLGLAICRQIVTLHGGRIWAESEGPDKGSMFVVRLPVTPASSQAA